MKQILNWGESGRSEVGKVDGHESERPSDESFGPSTFTQIVGIFLSKKKHFLWSKNGKITIKSIIDHEPKIGFKTLVLGGWKIFALDFTFIYYFLIDHNWESYDE